MGMTDTQADIILELTGGHLPKVNIASNGEPYLVYQNVSYFQDGDFNETVERLISNLRSEKQVRETLAAAEDRAREARLAEEAAAEEARRLEEERNRTPLEQAQHAWAESIEELSTFKGLALAGVNIVTHLLNDAGGFVSEEELVETLCWVQAEVIDTLLEFDDVPFYEGSLLALAGDVIVMNFDCDDDAELDLDGIEAVKSAYFAELRQRDFEGDIHEFGALLNELAH